MRRRVRFLLVLIALLGLGLVFWPRTQPPPAPMGALPPAEGSQGVAGAAAKDLEPARTPGASEEEELDDSPHVEIVTPFRDRGVGFNVIDDLRGAFDTHYEAALRGDPDSMLVMAHLSANCSSAGAYATVEAFDLASTNFLEESIPGLRSAIPDCWHIVNRFPDELTPSEWSQEWLNRAAEAGNPIAQLEMLIYRPPSETSYRTSLALLESAARSGNYRAYYQIGNFLFRYEQPSDGSVPQMEGSKWYYLACTQHPACDARVMRKNFEIDLLPRHVEEIQTFADNWHARIEDPTPFRFETGWTVEAEQARRAALDELGF